MEMGGGTGRNLEFLADRIHLLESIKLIDLSSALLEQARLRIQRHGWGNVETMQADATQVSLGSADVIVFSYSLTMIPNWFMAVDRAIESLKPNGILGVVDFYVSRKYPEAGFHKHGWFCRSLWPLWFANDNVNLSQDHLPYLQERLELIELRECVGKVPFLPFVRVPYYLFIGRKRSNNENSG